MWMEALADPRNPRGHPLLLALAFAFCPAAAGWWRAGAVPEIPPDPIRAALRDMAAGMTLREALAARGLEAVLEEAPRYIRAVAAFRRQHPGMPAPEASPLFPYDRLPLGKRFGLTDAVAPLGGWDGFYEYIRTWAFLAEDWARAMHFREARVVAVELALALPGIRRPARVPAFVFEEGPRQALALFEEGLAAELALRADRAGAAWNGRPEGWRLFPDGTAKPYVPVLEDGALREVVEALARMGREGPWPPLGAMGDPARCRRCGFRGLCWKEKALHAEALARLMGDGLGGPGEGARIGSPPKPPGPAAAPPAVEG